MRRAAVAIAAAAAGAGLVAAGGAGGQDPAPPRVEVFRIASPNMVPRLQPGERVEFDLDAYAGDAEPATGDIVLLHPPRGALRTDGQCGRPRNPGRRLCVEPRGRPAKASFVQRVVAVGGDRIAFRRGRFSVDGKRERRRLERCGSDEVCTFMGRIRVPAGHVYVAGDNRPSSDDSRFWGALSVEQVVGRYLRTLE